MSYQDERKDRDELNQDQDHVQEEQYGQDNEQELLTEAERESLWETDVREDQGYGQGAGQGDIGNNSYIKAPYDPEEPLHTALWKIWFSPKQTMRRILEVNPTYLVIFLVLLSGFAQGLGNFAGLTEFDYPFGVSLTLSIVFGIIAAFIMYFLMSALYKWVGGWLGGVATHQETRSVYAWSSVTNIVLVPVTLLTIAVIGSDYFYLDVLDFTYLLHDPVSAVVVAFSGLMSLIIGIWGIVIFIGALSEAHQFSIGKAIATALILLVISFVVIFVIGMIVGMVLIGFALFS